MNQTKDKIVFKLAKVANSFKKGVGKLRDSEGDWKRHDSESFEGPERVTASDRVKRIQLQDYILQNEITTDIEVEQAPAVWRNNLYAVCMPSGHGKSTLARWIDGIDVDELVPGRERWKYYDSIVHSTPNGEGTNEWVDACHKTLDKMVFKRPTLIFVHDPHTARALGCVRAGTIRVDSDVVRDANRGRSRVWHRARELSERLCREGSSRNNWVVSNFDAAKVRLARIAGKLEIPIPMVYKYKNANTVGYTNVEKYKDFRQWDDIGDLGVIYDMARDGEIPRCALVEFVDCLRSKGYIQYGAETDMGDYVALAREIAHRGAAPIAPPSGSVISQSLLVKQFGLDEHEDAMRILYGLPRSTSNFKMTVVLWWKTIGQYMECAHTLYKLIDGIEETEWPKWLTVISSAAQGGWLGQDDVADDEWLELDAIRRLESWTPMRDDLIRSNGVGLDDLTKEERLVINNCGRSEVKVDMNVMRGRAILDGPLSTIVDEIDSTFENPTSIELREVRDIDIAYNLVYCYYGGKSADLEDCESYAERMKHLVGRRKSLMIHAYPCLGSAVAEASDLIPQCRSALELVDMWVSRLARELRTMRGLSCKSAGFIHMYKTGITGGKRSLGALMLVENGLEDIGEALLCNVMRRHTEWNDAKTLTKICRDRWLERGGEGCEVLIMIGLFKRLSEWEKVHLGPAIQIERYYPQAYVELMDVLDRYVRELDDIGAAYDTSEGEYSEPDSVMEEIENYVQAG